MPLQNYGVLKARAIDRKLAKGETPHYEIHLVDDNNTHFRVAVNVQSQSDPSVLLCHIDEHFSHPILPKLSALPFEFTPIKSQPDGIALDYIRRNLFDREQLKPLAYHISGPYNDLNEKIDQYVQRTIAIEDAEIYAFGERWGPEDQPDPYFGFQPGNGIHDIHMNQGNISHWQNDDGVWQDGGLLFHFPSANQWVALFLAFQSQSLYTDDQTGHALEVRPKHKDAVKIIAARVTTDKENQPKIVTLINKSPDTVDLSGWSLINGKRKQVHLTGQMASGESLVVSVPKGDAFLPGNGGILSLLDEKDLKIDGIAYTKDQTNQQGWLLTF